ncbi:MAG: ATPase, T2SS/T4P/T4SS family [Planctomycetota bacterium]
MSKRQYQLNLVNGRATPIVLAEDAVTFGRHESNSVHLLDDRASRRHCVVEPDGRGGYTVRDLGSRNGTMVNDEKVSSTALSIGDVVRIGSVSFRFEERHEPSPAQRPPAAAPEMEETQLDTGELSLSESSEPEAAGENAGEEDHGFGGVDPDLEGLGLEDDEGEAPLPAPPPPPLDPQPVSHHTADTSWARTLNGLIDELPPHGSRESPIILISANRQESDILQSGGDGPAACRLILQLASKSRATDIHMEPKGDAMRTRLRVDGQMVSTVDLPHRVGELAMGVFRSACQMRQAAKDSIQEGHCAARFPDRRVDFRVSMTPTVHGPKLVVRVLDMRSIPKSLADLGFLPYMQERVREVCRKDSGLLLVCGPTGSGKTTTLYNALREIDRDSRNVITIEDPVEYQIDGTTQMPIDEKRGNSFYAVLRSVLRQDPDVILVGEIRDEDTARTAMQAAMTGHVVFTTLHAKDTVAAVFRLLDLGVEPYLVANSLDLVLAQRLVRVLCDSCKSKTMIKPGTSARVGKAFNNVKHVYSAVGCVRCLGTGYRGRRALFELLGVNNEMRDVILSEPSIAAMRKVIEQGHFDTLGQFGWKLAAEGATSVEEVEKVASDS